MKATGIVRRIDDLGRVVIPKEIRRTMRIREGDPLEIYTSRDGEVIFKKYSPVGDMGDLVSELCESMNRTTGITCAICDRDIVIAAAGSVKKHIFEKPISAALEKLMETRQSYQKMSGESEIEVCEDLKAAVVSPIITGGDVSGCVLFIDESETKKIGEPEMKVVQTAATFLGRQMEM